MRPIVVHVTTFAPIMIKQHLLALAEHVVSNAMMVLVIAIPIPPMVVRQTSQPISNIVETAIPLALRLRVQLAVTMAIVKFSHAMSTLLTVMAFTAPAVKLTSLPTPTIAVHVVRPVVLQKPANLENANPLSLPLPSAKNSGKTIPLPLHSALPLIIYVRHLKHLGTVRSSSVAHLIIPV